MSDRTRRRSTAIRLKRRQFLTVLGGTAATGLAGCLGGGPGDGESTADPAGGTPTAGSGGGTTSSGAKATYAACSKLTSGYETIDPGDRNFVFTCDRPAVLSQVSYKDPPTNAVQADTPSTVESTFMIVQQMQALGTWQESMGESSNRTFATTEFNGKQVAFEEVLSGETIRSVYGYVPYEIDGTLAALKLNISVENDGGGGSLPSSCQTKLGDALTHLLDSLAANPDATPRPMLGA